MQQHGQPSQQSSIVIPVHPRECGQFHFCTVFPALTVYYLRFVKTIDAHEVRLEPRMALLTRSRQNAIYQNQTVPQIVEKILRERHQMRGQDFVFNLKSEYPSREQVMQYGEDDLTFVSRLLSEVGIWFRFATDARPGYPPGPVPVPDVR